MEKQTRMSKYKQLRETINDEVAIQHKETIETVEDDDFLAFISKKEEVNLEDTLLEPKTFETLEEEKHVKEALNEAKVNVGKEAYNTRLDILSKIRSEEIKVKEEKPIEKEPAKKMSLLERLAAMSPEEDVEEFKEYEEEQKKTVEKKEIKEEKREDQVIVVDDDDDEEDSKLVTFLNYVIVAFMIIFVILIFIIVKELLL